MNLTVDALGRIAASARRGATIAGRCSVFAKSDMIHLQQKGTPREEIALGLCQALVRTFISTVMRGRRAELPVILVGGGANNPGLVRAFREVLRLPDDRLMVPPDPLYFGAIGAARMAPMATPLKIDHFRGALRERLNSHSLSPAEAGISLSPLGHSSPGEGERPAEDPGPVARKPGSVLTWVP